MKTAIPGAVVETVASHVGQPSKSNSEFTQRRDGSRFGVRRLEPRGTKQPYGVRPPTLPGRRRSPTTGDAPETSPCRRVRRFLDDGLDPRRVTVRGRPAAGESRPPSAGGDSPGPRRHQFIRARPSGRLGWAMVLRWSHVIPRSPARGPIQADGVGVGVGRSATSEVEPQKVSRESRSSPGAPVRQTAPRTGPVARIDASSSVHVFPLRQGLVFSASHRRIGPRGFVSRPGTA